MIQQLLIRYGFGLHVHADCIQTVPIVGKPEHAAQVRQGIPLIIMYYEKLADRFKETPESRKVIEKEAHAKVVEILNRLQQGL